MVTAIYTYLLIGALLTAVCASRLAQEEPARGIAAGLFIVLAWPVVVIGSMK